MKQLLATPRNLFKQAIFLGLMCFGLCTTSAWAATAVQSGNWNDAATWGGSVPLDTDDVLIPSGKTVTVPGSFSHTKRYYKY